MTLPSAKQIKDLAKTCRKVGIKHFKSADFEFTLTDELPISKSIQKSIPNSIREDVIASETINDEQLLFWSSATGVNNERPTN